MAGQLPAEQSTQQQTQHRADDRARQDARQAAIGWRWLGWYSRVSIRFGCRPAEAPGDMWFFLPLSARLHAGIHMRRLVAHDCLLFPLIHMRRLVFSPPARHIRRLTLFDRWSETFDVFGVTQTGALVSRVTFVVRSLKRAHRQWLRAGRLDFLLPALLAGQTLIGLGIKWLHSIAIAVLPGFFFIIVGI